MKEERGWKPKVVDLYFNVSKNLSLPSVSCGDDADLLLANAVSRGLSPSPNWLAAGAKGRGFPKELVQYLEYCDGLGFEAP